MNVLSLCSGVGGLDLGIRLAVPSARVVGYVEREAFCQAVLVARMEDKALDRAPIFSDLASFDGTEWCGVVDCVSAGFPCQPVSLAGKQLGQADERWIWRYVARVVREVGPCYVFLENVPALLTAGRGSAFGEVLGDLAALGFDAEWGVFGADDCGAPHQRKRVFILAYTEGRGKGWETRERSKTREGIERGSCEVADAAGARNRKSESRVPINDECIQGQQESSTDVDRYSGEDVADTIRDEWESRSGRERVFDVREGMADAEGGGYVGSGDAVSRRGERNAIGDGEEVGNGESGEQRARKGSREQPEQDRGSSGSVGDPNNAGLEGRSESKPGSSDERPTWPPSPTDADGWQRVIERWPDLSPATESKVRGVADGTSDRMDRLRALGNGVVPIVAATAWRELMFRASGVRRLTK